MDHARHGADFFAGIAQSAPQPVLCCGEVAQAGDLASGWDCRRLSSEMSTSSAAQLDFSQGSCDQCLEPLKPSNIYVELRPCGHLLCGRCKRDAQAIPERCFCCYAPVIEVYKVARLPVAPRKILRAKKEEKKKPKVVVKKESETEDKALADKGESQAEERVERYRCPVCRTSRTRPASWMKKGLLPPALQLPRQCVTFGAAMMPLSAAMQSCRKRGPLRKGGTSIEVYGVSGDESIYWPCCHQYTVRAKANRRAEPPRAQTFDLFRFRLLSPDLANAIHGLDKPFAVRRMRDRDREWKEGSLATRKAQQRESFARAMGRIDGIVGALRSLEASLRGAPVKAGSVTLTEEELKAIDAQSTSRNDVETVGPAWAPPIDAFSDDLSSGSGDEDDDDDDDLDFSKLLGVDYYKVAELSPPAYVEAENSEGLVVSLVSESYQRVERRRMIPDEPSAAEIVVESPETKKIRPSSTIPSRSRFGEDASPSLSKREKDSAIAQAVFQKRNAEEAEKRKEQIEKNRSLVKERLFQALGVDKIAESENTAAVDSFEGLLFRGTVVDKGDIKAYQSRATMWIRDLRKARNFDLRNMVRLRQVNQHEICNVPLQDVIREANERLRRRPSTGRPLRPEEPVTRNEILGKRPAEETPAAKYSRFRSWSLTNADSSEGTYVKAKSSRASSELDHDNANTGAHEKEDSHSSGIQKIHDLGLSDSSDEDCLL